MKRINILGTMGVGKSTLGKQLADFFVYPFHEEPFKPNSFLELSYADPVKYSLLCQLAFLPLFCNHSHKEGILDGSILCCRYVFSELYLNSEELKLYDKVYKATKENYVEPDLYICLQASTPVLWERITGRNREMEKDVRYEFLDELNNKMNNLFCYLESSYKNVLVLDWNSFGTVESVALDIVKYFINNKGENNGFN